MTVKLGDVETFHADLDETIAAQKADGTLVMAPDELVP